MIIVGYIAAVIMGAVLGLLGGGGSILTVPIFTYLLGVNASDSTTWSLFVVGVAAAIGVLRYMPRGHVDYRTALTFGIPSVTAVFLTQSEIRPRMPDVLFQVGGLEITRNVFLMLLFAVMMLAASYSMIRGRAGMQSGDHPNRIKLGIVGALVGFFAGLVGAGGGFIIVPALVLIAGLGMKKAVGTSLLIISAQSLIGFTGALSAGVPTDWGLLLPFTGFSVIGIIIGVALARYIPGAKLKPAFGWFTLGMGVYVVSRTLLELS